MCHGKSANDTGHDYIGRIAVLLLMLSQPCTMDIDAELVLSDREFEEKYILLPPLKCPSHLVTALPLDPFNVSLLYTLLGERREQATSPVLVWCRDRLPAISSRFSSLSRTSCERAKRMSISSSVLPVAERCNLGSVDPAGSEPAKGKDDFVQNDDDHGCQIGAIVCQVRRQGCEDDVHKHTNSATESRPMRTGPEISAMIEKGNGLVYRNRHVSV